MDFKVGDRVKLNDSSGKEGTVIGFSNEGSYATETGEAKNDWGIVKFGHGEIVKITPKDNRRFKSLPLFL